MNVKAALSLRWVQVLIVLVGWFVLATLLKGVQTQELSMSKDTAFTAVLREFASAIRGNRTESFLFVYFFNPIRAFISGFIELIMGVISMPAEGNLIPLIGWFGTYWLTILILFDSAAR